MKALPVLATLAACSTTLWAATVNLSGYHPASQAITARIEAVNGGTKALTGYLGVVLNPGPAGTLITGEVAMGSPAADAGILKGDTLTSIDEVQIHRVEEARTILQSKEPGTIVHLRMMRKSQELAPAVKMGATSRPLKTSARAILGLGSGEPREDGIPVTSVTKGKPADKAGLRSGDVILSLNGTELGVNGAELGEGQRIADLLADKEPGEAVTLRVRRGKEEFRKTITLVADTELAGMSPEERRDLNTWKKDSFRIAVIPIEYPDVKHDEKVALKNWEDAFFSHGTYHGTNDLKQEVYGSVSDYYQEASCGRLSITGKVFPWVMAGKNRIIYNQSRGSGEGKGGLLQEVLETLLARDGANALDDFDGISFIYSGVQEPAANRGSIYWPHHSSVRYEKKRTSYVIIPELKGAGAMSNISTMCHETGHSLGLPDLYARPENPGSEGVGGWCIMSFQSTNGRPQHFCAWSKEQLGWLKPIVIDPTVKQKLTLNPVEGSTTECLKVLVRRDGSEYFLLENRRKTGFDASLAAEGLLIWRVVANRPLLEEAHGITGPTGPNVYLSSVPFPSKANNSFTPYTTPSSRSQLGGGLPVFITNIHKLVDGRITLEIGYEFE